MKETEHILWFGPLCILLAAFTSVGFFHPDEHFQILEYLNVLQGGLDKSRLPEIEILEMMRPWLQPYLYYYLGLPLESFGPFVQSFFFRLITGGFGIWAMSTWLKILPKRKEFRWARPLLYTAWFVPFLLVRTSSDSLSAIFFFLGMGRWCLKNLSFDQLLGNWRGHSDTKGFGELGIWFGFAICIRYLTIVPIAGLLIWCLLMRQISFRHCCVFLLSFVGIALLGPLLDRIGHGTWTWSTWNHIRVNLFEGHSAHFGTLPVWGYFSLLLKKGVPILSLPILIACGVHLCKRPKSLLNWIILPTFLFYSLIGHKELRFLTPIILLGLVLFVIELGLHWKYFKRGWKKTILCFLFSLNAFIFLVFLFRPAYRPIGAYKVLWEKRAEQKVYVFWDNMNAQSARHLQFEMDWYKKGSWAVIPTNLEELGQDLEEGQKFILATSKWKEMEIVKKIKFCQNIWSAYPPVILKNNSFNWRDRSAIWALWQCRAPFY